MVLPNKLIFLFGFLMLAGLFNRSATAQNVTTAAPQNSTTAPQTTTPLTTTPQTTTPQTTTPQTTTPQTTTPQTTTPKTTTPKTTTPQTTTPQTTTPKTTTPQTTTPETTTTEAPTTAAPTTAAPTTAATTTTLAPTPTPSSDEAVKTYNVSEGNSSCLMMTMGAHFQYNENNTTKTINVTSDYDVDAANSDCNTLMISSTAGNHLTFTFKQSADNKTYDLDEVDVDFVQVNATKSKLHIGEVALKASYVCKSGAKIDFGDGMVLTMKDIQFQAFTVEDDKYSTGQVCVADTSKSFVVPIAVGCALAGLVLVVLVSYCVGKRRVKLPYEAM